MTIKQLQDIFPNATTETWHQHANGGGWVQNTARVEETAYVGPDAQVYGNAWVYGDGHPTSPFYWQGPRHSLTLSKCNVAQVGCHQFNLCDYERSAKLAGKREGYTEAEIELYLQMLAIAKQESDRRWPQVSA